MTAFDVDRARDLVEAAALRVIQGRHYARETDPHAGAQLEWADELLALAARDLVRAVEALPEEDRPIGWDVAEVVA